MRYLWDFIIILSILPWILRLAAEGYISPRFVALVLVAIVFFRALGRGCGGGLGRLIRATFLMGIPIASLLTFTATLGGGSYREIASILSRIVVLFIILVGFYIMFLGPFSSKR